MIHVIDRYFLFTVLALFICITGYLVLEEYSPKVEVTIKGKGITDMYWELGYE